MNLNADSRIKNKFFSTISRNNLHDIIYRVNIRSADHRNISVPSLPRSTA